jgi:hypothetical protein
LTWDDIDVNTSYIRLWNATATALKRVNKAYKVGGPATQQLQHISDFVDQCNANSLPCDFVSSHLYPSDPQCPQTVSGWDPSCFSRLVKAARASVPTHMEFFVTEMSVTVKYHHGRGPVLTVDCCRAFAPVTCDTQWRYLHMVRYPETELPEKGSTNCSGCDQHDTSAAAAFVFRVLGEISGPHVPDAMSYWTCKCCSRPPSCVF